VFTSEMNDKIKKADTQFSKMQIKDALRYCYFELCNARDFYRMACNSESDPSSLHRDVVLRFIEVFCIMMSPFIPHFCEHIYGKLKAVAPSKSALTAPAYLAKHGLRETLEEMVNDVLKKKPANPYETMAKSLRSKAQPIPSVMDERWPEAGPIDLTIMAAAKYLDDTLHTVRLRMSQGPQTGGKKKKKGKGPSGPPPKALSIKIFVATEYPESSQKVLLFLQANYDAVCRLCCAHMPLPAGHLCTCRI
jgi:valyl-tRNA synthetase